MAEWGAGVSNNGGYIQIDSTYQNLSLRSKGSVGVSGLPTDSGYYVAAITLPASIPIMCWRANAPAFMQQAVPSGGNVTYYFFVKSSGGVVQYWAFDQTNLGAVTGNWGIDVRDPGGAVRFDSRAKYMRVVAFVGAQGAAVGDPIVSGISGSTGAGLLAVMQGCSRYTVENVTIPGDPDHYYSLYKAAVVTFSGSGGYTLQDDTINFQQYDSDQLGPLAWQQYSYSYLFVDVANL